jgi:katanin p80 WD40 repeat-containing subunit B1
MKPVDAEHPSSERTEEIFCPQKSLPRTPRTFRVDKSANQSHPTEVSQSSTKEPFLQFNQEVTEKTKANTSVLPVTIIDLGETIKQIPSNANAVIKERKPVNPTDKPIAPTDKSNNHGYKILTTPFINQTPKSLPPMEAPNDPLNPPLTTVPSRVLHPDPCSLTNFESRSSSQIPTIAEPQIFPINPDIAPSTSDYDITAALKKNHQAVLHALQSRRQNLRQLYEAWCNKDVKTTAEMAVKFNDLTALADFLGILTTCRPSKWTLDVCVILLPALVKLVQSRHDTHTLAGCHGLRSMLRNFASVIRTNVASPIETLGVDLTQEERYNKSLLCHQHLLLIKQYLTNRSLRGSVGQASKEVLGLLSWLELES